jgi:hypothetical protein
MAIRLIRLPGPSAISLVLLVVIPMTTAGQMAQRTVSRASDPPDAREGQRAAEELDGCRVHQVTAFPGSHQFATDFIETMATASGPDDGPQALWALTADLSSSVPPQQQALYISKSADGGATWVLVARLDSRYFDARIAEGLRNGLAVLPDGAEFVVTTQRGAFQVLAQPNPSEPIVKAIPGPRVSDAPPKIPITKKSGDPVRANVVAITADGQRMLIGYGYFDLEPQIFQYHRGEDGSWIEDGPLPPLPTEMDLFSIDFDDPQNPEPGFLYVGTGDQAYIFNFHTRQWSRVHGVGPDSAIHGMNVVGGLHIAACWGIYDPEGPGTVRRIINVRFLLHPGSDEVGPNLRAYGIEVDPAHPGREAVTSITGVYVSEDSGESWRRLSDLPGGEYHSAHFNADGTLIVSGMPGTFLVNPFSQACTPRLRIRRESPSHD